MDHFGSNYAPLDSFFGDGNNLTNFGDGYDSSGGGGSNEYRSNGGYHQGIDDLSSGISSSSCASGKCGSDPAALARANLEWEQRAESAENFNGNEQPEEKGEAESGSLEITDYLYQIGADALDFDPEDVAPSSGMEYWKKRMPSILIALLTILGWIWIWSHFGFSKILKSTPGNIVYWGIIVLTFASAFMSDHRSCRYDDERDQLKTVESNLKLLVKVISGGVVLLLSFKLLDKKPSYHKQAAISALALSFFLSLFGLISISSKKRGEHVRTFRKIKAAILNLTIGLLAVGVLLTFNIGTAPAGNVVGGGIEGGIDRPVEVRYVSASKGKKSKKGGGSTEIHDTVTYKDVPIEVPVVTNTIIERAVPIPVNTTGGAMPQAPTMAPEYAAPAAPMPQAPTVLQSGSGYDNQYGGYNMNGGAYSY